MLSLRPPLRLSHNSGYVRLRPCYVCQSPSTVLQSFLRARYPQFGFTEVITPTICKKSLWEMLGHWENYAEDMFEVKGRGASGQTANTEIGQDEDRTRSYRDLPIRYADFSALHRNEISGALSRLTRVKRPSQILDEIRSTLDFVGMDWNKAEEQLKSALEHSGREWSIKGGDEAFYGPKIDIIVKDSHGEGRQTATIQLDFQLPQRFKLQCQAASEDLETAVSSYEGSKTTLENRHARPVIIHRAILGSLEQFMALLIEHCAGIYPFWFSPRPAIILSLNQDPEVLSHVHNMQRQLSDTSPRSLGKKIHDAEKLRYNLIIVVGPTEANNGKMRLEIANQPEATEEYAMEVLKGTLDGKEYNRGIETSGEDGRKYFEALIERYL
ncbi:class II aaRS and biotin synthetase [Cenococcum geophilum 1.58]|uniref:class II aaRS and biotin synthetase n=1 Tax=Cenococcum geophilum 1.58 TaxID=794803 RepID=UPI00358F5AFD|nr:class II aaRS and biotin synthetase [Cenococcum geophilum 1.58]